MTLLLALLALVVAAPADASPGKLAMHKARAVTAKQARSFKRDLETEGANGSRVSDCERRSARRVVCIAVVTGYDDELDWDWTCVTQVKVRRGASRIRVGYGQSACG